MLIVWTLFYRGLHPSMKWTSFWCFFHIYIVASHTLPLCLKLAVHLVFTVAQVLQMFSIKYSCYHSQTREVKEERKLWIVKLSVSLTWRHSKNSRPRKQLEVELNKERKKLEEAKRRKNAVLEEESKKKQLKTEQKTRSKPTTDHSDNCLIMGYSRYTPVEEAKYWGVNYALI